MSMDNFINMLTDEQKQALLQALTGENTKKTKEQPIAKEESIPSDGFIAQTKVTNSQTTTSKYSRREPVRARENRWEDTGEFRDIETPEVERTPRRRPPPKKVDVECSSCGKSFKVDARFVYGEYYRCNRCASRK